MTIASHLLKGKFKSEHLGKLRLHLVDVVATAVQEPRSVRPRRGNKKHDRRDAHLLLDLLVMKDRFPKIWDILNWNFHPGAQTAEINQNTETDPTFPNASGNNVDKAASGPEILVNQRVACV